MQFFMNINIFELFSNYLKEQPCNNIYQNMKQNTDYLNASLPENELNKQYKKLGLSYEQRKAITQWIATVQIQESAYTAVIFHTGMQFCFSLLTQLADL